MTKPIWTTKKFDKLVKDLAAKYRRIDEDIEQFSEQLKNGLRMSDDRLKDVGGARVYQARISNRSAKSGKRGGFRVTYYDDIEAIWLLHIGLRRDQDGINPKWIRQAIKHLQFE